MRPNQKLQQAAAAILISLDVPPLSAAAAAELHRSTDRKRVGMPAGVTRRPAREGGVAIKAIVSQLAGRPYRITRDDVFRAARGTNFATSNARAP